MKMPDPKPSYIDLATKPEPGGREDYQDGWQTFVGGFLNAGTDVLDVGAGLGRSRERLARKGARVVLQDPAPVDTVDIHTDIHELEAGQFDFVTCFDVLEHVREDWSFLAQLLYICRRGVVLTTPNYRVSATQNPCHVREYTPPQLRWLASRLGSIYELRTGEPHGDAISLPLSPKDFDLSLAPHLYVHVTPKATKYDQFP